MRCWLRILITLVTSGVPTWVAAAELGPDIYGIVGPALDLPIAPRYVAVGDLDRDGLADAVASCDGCATIVSAMSAGDGSFREGVPFDPGRRVGAVALLHANTDDFLDLVTTDRGITSLGGGVFVANGSGDGRYGLPSFIDATTRAAAITVADFDGRGGQDIVTANGRRTNVQTRNDDVTIILNRGLNRGFDPGIALSVAPDAVPVDIEAASLNGDGTVDLVVIDANPNAEREVVVLPSRSGNMSCQFIYPSDCDVWTEPTRLGAVALTVKDFNEDGVPDIAVANSDSTREAHSISILLNNTRSVDGDKVGTAWFDSLPPVAVSCPTKINGQAVSCVVRDIGAADFNRDGFNDVVVSIATSTDSSEARAPGIVAYYRGLGDGRVEHSTSVNVGSGAAALGIGDFNGDSVPDIVVAEEDDKTLTIVRTARPDPPARCAGDCDGDLRVTVDEIVSLLAIALGNVEPLTCSTFERAGVRRVAVDDLVTAVANALRGCSNVASL